MGRNNYFLVFRKMLTLIIFLSLLYSQIIINEMMIDPIDENTGEFIELYNISDTTINLSKFYICDEQDTDHLIPFPDSLLLAQHYAIILDPNYEEDYDDIIPDCTSILSIEDSRFGKYGISNSTEKNFSILNQEMQILDTYRSGTPIWAPSNYSIERYLPHNNTWMCSEYEQGTPGIRNSCSPKYHNINISGAQFINYGASLQLEITGENTGMDSMLNFQYQVNINFSKDPNELEFERINHVNMIVFPEDTFILKINVPYICKGHVDGKILVLGEDYSDSLNFFDHIPLMTDELIINEFIPKPQQNFSAEYIELISKSCLPIQLEDLEIHDLTGYCSIDTSYILYPDSIIVLAQSLKFHDDFPLATNYIIPSPWRSLNNTEDLISISNPLSSNICNIHYNNDWPIENDCVIQLIDTSLNYRDPRNWEANPWGSPGKTNTTSQQLMHLSCYSDKDFYSPFDTLFFNIVNDGFYVSKEQYMLFNAHQTIFLPSILPGDTFVFYPDTSIINDTGTHEITLSCTPFFNKKINYYRPYLNAPCLINEIFFNPNPCYAQEEFIELENLRDTINFDHWTLRVNNSIKPLNGNMTHFYTLLCSSESCFANYSCSIPMVSFPALPNSGAEVYLIDPMNRIIDFADFRDHSQITEGKSLEKKFQSISSTNSLQWHASVSSSGMTPGKRNSITSLPASHNSLSIYPEIFTPTIDDFIQFSIDSENGLEFCELFCFNTKGTLVFKKTQNCFSQASTLIFWDGKLTDGSWPSRGIYLIIVLMHDLNNSVFRIKKSFIIR